MKLYIKVENNQPLKHPAFEDNLIQAFGSIPAEWEPFTRVERPKFNTYQTMDSDIPVYTKVNGVWTDVWTVREMTAEEKAAVQKTTIDSFNARPQAENWSAWTFDEATNTMVPPIPRPEPDQAKLDQGIRTFWCGADANWKDTPVRPEGEYKFDFIAWAWIAI